MTFTEAAVEVLRRAGKPLHYKEIAEAAVRENLLSHVGQDPETTMGQRLAAMARREEERRVVAVAPDGTFALTEWSVPAELVVEAKAPPEPQEDGEPQYRGREREPRPIHSQARRRMEAIAGGEPDEPRREGREREGGRDRDRDRDRKRSPIPAEAALEWLGLRGSGAPLVELAAGLVASGAISESLGHDIPSLTAALLEDNRRRTEAGRKPAFIIDGERATLVEFPAPGALAELERSPQSSLGRPSSAESLTAEGKRACVRALRSRLADLETAGFEQVCAVLLEKMGMRDLRVAKRSKDGPLYLARQRWGVSDLRVAVRLVRGRREIGRQDVLELRRDLAHYSAQMAMLLAPGEAGRESRAEASAAAQPPIALYAGEALAEELVARRVGVTVQVVEIADVDEAFFAAARGLKPGREGRAARGEPDAKMAEGFGPTEPAASTPTSSESPERATAPAREQPVAVDASPRSESRAADASAPEERKAQDPARRGRPERQERPERVRISSPADQAWGQPMGTPKKSVMLAALAAQSAARFAERGGAPAQASGSGASGGESPAPRATDLTATPEPREGSADGAAAESGTPGERGGPPQPQERSSASVSEASGEGAAADGASAGSPSAA